MEQEGEAEQAEQWSQIRQGGQRMQGMPEQAPYLHAFFIMRIRVPLLLPLRRLLPWACNAALLLLLLLLLLLRRRRRPLVPLLLAKWAQRESWEQGGGCAAVGKAHVAHQRGWQAAAGGQACRGQRR